MILARTRTAFRLVDRLIADGIPVSLKNGVAAFQSDQTRELIAASAIASPEKINRAWNRKINSKLLVCKKTNRGYLGTEGESFVTSIIRDASF